MNYLAPLQHLRFLHPAAQFFSNLFLLGCLVISAVHCHMDTGDANIPHEMTTKKNSE
jgi:hypothetical protein